MSGTGTNRPIGFRPEEISALINEDVVTQHADDAASLWMQRDDAIGAPHYSLQDLADLDERVEANLDGLRIAGDFGWNLCKEALGAGEPGEVFAAAVLAFGAGGSDRIDTVLEVAVSDWSLGRGAVSALSWLPFDQARRPIRDLMESEDASLRRLGIAASAAHRKNPADRLARAVQDSDAALRAQALKAAGELGRTDLMRLLAHSLADPDDACRFHAGASCLRLSPGRSDVANALRSFVTPGDPFAAPSLAIVLRTIGIKPARQWCDQLRHTPDSLRLAIIGYGILGDPVAVDDLISCMGQDDVARVSGEAFSMITGIDLAYDDLERDQPEDFEAGPSESPDDEDVAMDPDEDLPWPDPELVAKWWGSNKSKFTPGKRYLKGKEISAATLRETLLQGFQRQRTAAALELAVMHPDQALFEVRAEGKKQQKELEAWSS